MRRRTNYPDSLAKNVVKKFIQTCGRGSKFLLKVLAIKPEVLELMFKVDGRCWDVFKTCAFALEKTFQVGVLCYQDAVFNREYLAGILLSMKKEYPYNRLLGLWSHSRANTAELQDPLDIFETGTSQLYKS